ncbi:YuzL family protein [Bacillus pinisoli]|nr:YuzL family protein [Bacillus pinisoli]
MAKLKKNPSERAKSAASVKGTAGPTVKGGVSGKTQSTNQQYGKSNMGEE